MPGSNGERLTYRTATGGGTTSSGSGAVSYPNTWLRRTRGGIRLHSGATPVGFEEKCDEFACIQLPKKRMLARIAACGLFPVGANGASLGVLPARDLR